MSSGVSSIDRFRSALLNDSVKLIGVRDDLLITTGTTVPLELHGIVGRIYQRWAKINNTIREPDSVSVAAFDGYINYLLMEIEKWKGRDLMKFNRSVNVLYSTSQSRDISLDDLISAGMAHANPRVVNAAHLVEQMIKMWMAIFPNITVLDREKTDGIEMYIGDLRSKCELGLIACDPESRIFDLADRSYDGESGQASWMSEDVFQDLPSHLFQEQMEANDITCNVYGNRGFTRQITVCNPTANILPQNGSHDLEIIRVKDGGLTIELFIEELFRGASPNVYLQNGNVINQINTAYLPHGTTVAFRVVGNGVAAGEVVYDLLEPSAVTLSVPFNQGSEYTVNARLTVAAMNPITIAGLYISGVNFSLIHPRSVPLVTEGNVPATGVPYISDLIGRVASPFSNTLLSDEHQTIWRMVRAYAGYQSLNAQTTIVNGLMTYAQTAGIATTYIDFRILSFSWWISETGDMNTQNKQTLYRRFYHSLFDYVVLALSDTSFRRQFLG